MGELRTQKSIKKECIKFVILALEFLVGSKNPKKWMWKNEIQEFLVGNFEKKLEFLVGRKSEKKSHFFKCQKVIIILQ